MRVVDLGFSGCGIISIIVVGKHSLKFLRLFAHFEPIEKQFGNVQPDFEPAGNFFFFTTLFRAHPLIPGDALGALPPFDHHRTDKAGSHTV